MEETGVPGGGSVGFGDSCKAYVDELQALKTIIESLKDEVALLKLEVVNLIRRTKCDKNHSSGDQPRTLD